jgi:hypothetical protein
VETQCSTENHSFFLAGSGEQAYLPGIISKQKGGVGQVFASVQAAR